MATFTSLFSWGDYVYVATDHDQRPRMIVEVIFTPGCVMYGLSEGTTYSKHYEIELSTEKNPLIHF